MEKTFSFVLDTSEVSFVESLKSNSNASKEYEVSIERKKVRIEKRTKMLSNGGFSDWAIAEIDFDEKNKNGKSNKVMISYNPYLKLIMIIITVLPIIPIIKTFNWILFFPIISFVMYLPFLAGIFIAREQFEKIIVESIETKKITTDTNYI